MNYRVATIGGDGIGPEIVAEAQRVLEAALRKCGKTVEFESCLAGGVAIDAAGHPLPKKTLLAAKNADAVLLGAVGGPKWDDVPPELRAEKAILGLRQGLKLYANLRPIRVPAMLAERSPLKPENVTNVDILIVRELSGGIYYGERQESHLVDGVEQAYDKESYSVPEVERIARFAFEAAKLRKKQVTSVDKANVLATSRLWRRTVQNLAETDQTVKVNHLYVDNCAMQLILAPRQFDVILTNNLFGDILSDEAAVIAGSIGMLPSASIGSGTGLYEPIHGSAPDIAGKGLANPLGTILSAALLLRYSLQEEAAARMVESAVDKVLEAGYRTVDLYKNGLTQVTTSEMGRQVERQIAGM